MIKLKSKEEIKIMREGGKRHAEILKLVAAEAKPGVSTKALDDLAFKLIKEGGDKPAFKGYTPEGVSYPYPASLCVSINDEIVHGIPNKKVLLQEGDIVSLDLGLVHKGLITDGAITVAVGKISKEAKELIRVTKKALELAVAAAQPGNRVGDIGHAVESYIKPLGYGIVKILSGHGVGYSVHEDPYIPNFGKKGKGEKLVPGMVIAIEPMVNIGTEDVYVTEDEYTFITKDGKLSAHFEHTVAITEKGPVILTK